MSDPLSKPATPIPPCLALRPREAAAALGISERTLWAWTATGDVPHLRRDKVVLYSVDSLRAWLAEQSKSGEAR